MWKQSSILSLMFPSYVVHPKNCSFEGQDPEEKILLLLRAHPITNIPWIAFAILVFFIPFFVPKITFLLNFNLSSIPQNFQLIYLVINYLFVGVIAFEGFLNWYFNATLITNEKIVDIDFEYLLYKGVDLAPLTKIEEADSITAGILGTIFNFGNVSVQTAGAKVAIEMKNIPKPSTVADLILDLAKKPHEHILGVPKVTP